MKTAEISSAIATLMGFRSLFLLLGICFAVRSCSVCESAGNEWGSFPLVFV